MEDRRAELKRLLREKRNQRAGRSTLPSRMPDPTTLLLSAGVDDLEILHNAPRLVEHAKTLAASGGTKGFLEALARGAVTERIDEETPSQTRAPRRRRRGRKGASTTDDASDDEAPPLEDAGCSPIALGADASLPIPPDESEDEAPPPDEEDENASPVGDSEDEAPPPQEES
jgi:hypothetical protein